MLRLLATATAATALLFSPTPGVLVLSPALTGPRTTYIRQRVNQIVAARLESWRPRHRRGAGSTHRLVRAQVLRRPPRGRVVRARVEGGSPVLRLGPRAAATGVEITPSSWRRVDGVGGRRSNFHTGPRRGRNSRTSRRGCGRRAKPGAPRSSSRCGARSPSCRRPWRTPTRWSPNRSSSTRRCPSCTKQ